MKKSVDAISPYYEVFNISDARQLSAFSVQLQRYFREQDKETTRWVKSVDGPPMNLTILEACLYDRFGITSQALRCFAQYAREQNWCYSKSAAIGNALATMQSEALAGRLDTDSATFARLVKVDQNVGHFLNVSRDPAARHLRPFDLVGWERILDGSYESARVVQRRSAERSEAPQSRIVLTDSQRDLLAPLEAHWCIKQRGVTAAGYDLRPIPLIVGPSGSGKSALVRYFATRHKLPMKDFTVGTWIVTGAKEPPTLGVVGDFLRDNEQGVLFIDEVDKTMAASDWTRCIQQEIYALLDGRTDSFPGWDKELQKKLARDFFIVGAGTWQTRYAGRQQSLGFGATETPDAWTIELDRQDEIPEELLMRFNADVLYLRPLTGAEFEKRIVSIHKKLNRECPTEERLRHLAEKALASRRHNRWLEAYASRLLRSDIP